MKTPMTSATGERNGVGWPIVPSIAAAASVSILGVAIASWVLETPTTKHLTEKIDSLALYAAMATVSLLAVAGTRRGWRRSVVVPLKVLSVGWAVLMSFAVLNVYFFRCAA